jgi:hypothetical protein
MTCVSIFDTNAHRQDLSIRSLGHPSIGSRGRPAGRVSKKVFPHACKIHAGTGHIRLHLLSNCTPAYNCTRDLCFQSIHSPPLKQPTLDSLTPPLGFLAPQTQTTSGLHIPQKLHLARCLYQTLPLLTLLTIH